MGTNVVKYIKWLIVLVYCFTSLLFYENISTHFKRSPSPLKDCKIFLCSIFYQGRIFIVPHLLALTLSLGYYGVIRRITQFSRTVWQAGVLMDSKVFIFNTREPIRQVGSRGEKTIWRGFVFSTSSYSKKEIFIKSIWIITELEKCIIVTKAWNECTPYQCTWNENHKENK